jgi:hypothetical protein
MLALLILHAIKKFSCYVSIIVITDYIILVSQSVSLSVCLSMNMAAKEIGITKQKERPTSL